MFVRVNGQRVHVVRFGNGSRTIVGLPGSFGTTEIWEQPFELLSARFHTVTFDHFGTGETYVPEEFVTFGHQVDLVTKVVEELEISRFVLAGDSSMGTVALEVAVRYPERVEALVLVATGISYAPNEATKRFVSELRTNPDPVIEGFAQLCLPEDDEGHLRIWLRDIINRTGPLRAAHLVESFYPVDIRDRLCDVVSPTLILHGELDALPSSRLETAEEMAALIVGAQLDVLNGVGHVPTLSRPREIADAIQAFVLETE